MCAKQLLAVVCVSFLLTTVANGQRFKVLYEWNYINFTWFDEDHIQSAVTSGRYIPENNIISGIKYYDDYFYITLPRMKEGVPATLARIPAKAYENDTEPLLEPFPSWGMNTEGDCNAFQNVQNVEIDTKGRMWILDGGRTSTMTKLASTKCRPRLVIFDIKNNQTVTNYYFPETVTNNRSYLYDLVLDDVDGGYAYITDNSGADPGIIVYSAKKGKSWKVRDNATMRASPESIEFRVSGTAITAPINLAGIALGTRTTNSKDHTFVSQDRTVYFCPLSSSHLYSIDSSDLKDENLQNPSSKIKDLGKKSSQTDGMVTDEHGKLYYGLLGDSSIAIWDPKTPFTSGQKIIARDTTHIQWPDSLTFDDDGNLLVVTNRLQKFIYGQINISEPNFRILEAAVGVKSYLFSVPEEIPEKSESSSMPNMHNEQASNPEHEHSSTSGHPMDAENEVLHSSAVLHLRNSLLLVISVFVYFIQ